MGVNGMYASEGHPSWAQGDAQNSTCVLTHLQGNCEYIHTFLLLVDRLIIEILSDILWLTLLSKLFLILIRKIYIYVVPVLCEKAMCSVHFSSIPVSATSYNLRPYLPTLVHILTEPVNENT